MNALAHALERMWTCRTTIMDISLEAQPWKEQGMGACPH
jgi:hypothetical protein